MIFEVRVQNRNSMKEKYFPQSNSMGSFLMAGYMYEHVGVDAYMCMNMLDYF